MKINTKRLIVSLLSVVAVSSFGYSIAFGYGGGGGGGGGGSWVGTTPPPSRPQIIYPDGRIVYLDVPIVVPTITPANPTRGRSGQVLGASTFQFTRDLAIGSRGEDVTELQNRLIAEGFLSSEATGYFGSLTREAVKKFQAKNGIDTTGTVGPKTRVVLNGSNDASAQTSGNVLGASAFNFTQNLSVGSRGDEVIELQKRLISDGFLSEGNDTGYFGALTESAVRKFQEKNGIEQVGVVGPKTRAALNK